MTVRLVQLFVRKGNLLQRYFVMIVLKLKYINRSGTYLTFPVACQKREALQLEITIWKFTTARGKGKNFGQS